MNRSTWSLWALCIGNFVIGTGALIVPGMLPSAHAGGVAGSTAGSQVPSGELPHAASGMQ